MVKLLIHPWFMVRGGKRDNAGRKSTWVSGVKFEDTTLIRVPSYIKDRVLEIAHRIDSGENLDLACEIKSELDIVKEKNNDLTEKLRLLSLELNTKSKQYFEKVESLEFEITGANITFNENLAYFSDSINDFLQEWKRQLVCSYKINSSLISEIAVPGNSALEIATKSNNPMQLDLLNQENQVENFYLKPLNNTRLALRLGIDNSNLVKMRKRKGSEFSVYSASKDPDKIGWRYSEPDKLYYPIN